MKKLFFSLALLGSLTACKKNQQQNTETKYTLSVNNEPVVEKSSDKGLKKLSLAELNEFFKEKNNDTLYVTNFFATWCPPCVAEIPHFKEQLEKRKNEKIVFRFISLDNVSDWDTKVKAFGEKHGISSQIYLVNGQELTPDFFGSHFKKWSGESIPFTYFRKGNRVEEVPAMISSQDLENYIQSFK